MPSHSAAHVREQITAHMREQIHAQHHGNDYASLAAASVCFQSAGQVLTVLAKIDRHFNDDPVSIFAKRTVAEFAAKQDAQMVAVTIIQASGHNVPNNAQHFVHGDSHYAVTVGNLADERTRMDHLARVMERLKYLQAVMVMLSTTDMLGTSEALGKHMGGMTARLQQVQKLGQQLELLTNKIERAKKNNQPLSQKAFEKHLSTLVGQLQKLQTGASPELRRVLQTMMAQVKEMRQWPNPSTPQRAPITPLKLVAKNDGILKTEHRFKAQPPKLHLRVVDGGRSTQSFSNRTALRLGSSTTFRISPIIFGRIATQIRSTNDHRFRVAPRIITRIVPSPQRHTLGQQQTVKYRAGIPAQRRFSSLAVRSKSSVALTGRATNATVSQQNLHRRLAQHATQSVHPIQSTPSLPHALPQTVQNMQVDRTVSAQTNTPLGSPPTPRTETTTTGQPTDAGNQSRVSQQSLQVLPPSNTQEHIIKGTIGEAAPITAREIPTQLAYARTEQKQVGANPSESIGTEIRIEPNSTALKANNHPVDTKQVGEQPIIIQPQHVKIAVSGAKPNESPPSNQTASPSASTTSVPSIPRVEIAQPAQIQQPPAQQQAQPPLIEQYKQAAQDFSERIVRGAQEFSSQLKQRVETATQVTVQQVSNIVARTMPDLQTITGKVNGAIDAAYKTAAETACAISCALKMPCAFCSRPPPKGNLGMMNNMKAL